MKTLQEICYDSLAESLYNAPPQIQEMVMGETKKRIEKRVREEVAKDVEKKITPKVFRSVVDMCTLIIPEFVTDIVACTVIDNRTRKPYFDIYKKIDENHIDMLLQASETIAKRCIIDRLENGEDSFHVYLDSYNENDY
jgi:hypothetical protein